MINSSTHPLNNFHKLSFSLSMEHNFITKGNIESPFYKLGHDLHNFMFKPMTDQSHKAKPKHTESSTMDNNEDEEANYIASLILHGCKLARELESNITRNNLTMSKSLDEIIKVFVSAKVRVDSEEPSSSSTQYNMLMDEQQQQIDHHHPMVQEWLRSSCAQATILDIIQTQLGVDNHNYSSAPSSDHGIHLRDSGEGDPHEPQIHPMDRDISIASSSQRPRKRKDDGLIKKLTVPAPRIGNTEIPPEDGFTWRKYGQKEIMGSKFPRGYYRCTHQKLYNCPAKKQVQRLDNDPLIYEVMYRGDHTCHMSATAPSILQPISAAADHHHTITTQTTSTTAIPTTTTHGINQPPTLGIGNWLSMDFNPGGSSSGGTLGSGGRGGGGGGGDASTSTRYGKEVEFPVMDLADAMFNSGSSSSNSMDFIFTSAENKWDSGDNKKN